MNPVAPAKTKPSSIPWLGELPEHWEVKRLRYVVTKIGSGKTPKGGAESYPTEGIPFIRSQNVYDDGLRLDDVVYIDEVMDDEMSSTRTQANDVLLNITGASIGRCAKVPEGFGPANVNQHVSIIRPDRRLIDQGFLHAFLCSQATKAAILADEVGSSREALNSDQIAGLPIALPPLPEQRAIAAYLDERTARIDGLLARKRRLVELLKEKRQALITRAVTRGLAAGVKLKDSGVPWLGKVPVGWEVKKLKHISKFVTSGSRGWAEHYAMEGAVFIRIGNLDRKSIDLRLDDIQRVDPPTSAEVIRTRALPDDLLISITAFLGTIGIVPKGLGDAYINQHTALIRLHANACNPRFVAYWFSSSAAQQQFNSASQGGTKEGMNLQEVRDLIAVQPNKNEQEQIANALDASLFNINALITKVEQAISRLQEYRTALISAAVTGKVRVV